MTPETQAAAARISAWLDADDPSVTPDAIVSEFDYAGDHFELRHADLRLLLAAVYERGEPCDGERCEEGGGLHCHRCAEVEADKLLAERNELRDRIANARSEIAKRDTVATLTMRPGFSDVCDALAAVETRLLDPADAPIDDATETRIEWANLMRFADGSEEITHPVGETLARERRRRFPKLHIALLRREVRYGPWTNGETGSAVTARHRPLTDEPCDVILTERGRQAVIDYRAIRREQHPRPRT